MSDLFTDDDVMAALGALDADCFDILADNYEPLIRLILTAVAPAIAVRALRQAADAWVNSHPSFTVYGAPQFLQNRADRIEGVDQ